MAKATTTIIITTIIAAAKKAEKKAATAKSINPANGITTTIITKASTSGLPIRRSAGS